MCLVETKFGDTNQRTLSCPPNSPTPSRLRKAPKISRPPSPSRPCSPPDTPIPYTPSSISSLSRSQPASTVYRCQASIRFATVNPAGPAQLLSIPPLRGETRVARPLSVPGFDLDSTAHLSRNDSADDPPIQYSLHSTLVASIPHSREILSSPSNTVPFIYQIPAAFSCRHYRHVTLNTSSATLDSTTYATVANLLVVNLCPTQA